MRHGGVEGKIGPLVVVAERNAVVVEEHFWLAERQRLMGVWRENASYQIDRTAVMFRILRPPWAEMTVVVVDEDEEVALAVCEERAWGERMLHCGQTVAEAQEILGFSSYAFFFRTFQKITGISPSKYRKLHKSQAIAALQPR